MIEHNHNECMAHILCNNCGKVIPAERTHNGVCECWLGHCCGYGQDAAIGAEVDMRVALKKKGNND